MTPLPTKRLTEGRVLAWMCAIIFVNQLGFGAIVPVLPLYAKSFDVSVSAIGVTIAAFGAARFVSAVPCGNMADALGRRPTLALGGLIAVVGNLWSAWAGTFTEFLLARFVAGVGAGVVITIGAVVLADISTPARRGRMMALYQGSFLFAVGLGPLPGGLLAEHYGLAAPFVANAVAALLVGLIAWFAVPETRDFGGQQAIRAADPVPFARQVRLMTAKVGFMLVCLVGFVHAIVRTGGLFNIVPLVGAGRLGLSTGQIGSGFALGSLLGLLATYPAGVLADRHGRKPVIVIAALLTGLSFFGFRFADGYVGFVSACLVWGVAAAVTGAAPAAYAADNAPPGMNAAAMSTYRALTDAGYVVGPIGLGLFTDLAGPNHAIALCAVAITLVALAFARFAPESYRGR
ncbi:MAG: MFS transporter [Burkholderiaceae bacterium]|nr:MFS transporter [Burkholderiaceae bacterium]